jgi:hypothetical protein
MPQKTNLNVSPYFDDFDPSRDYHRVLFKPGYPVQARELTGLQSILQNQIERFGQHFFKEGAKVIPGNIGYTQLYYCVQLSNTYLGVPVAAYVEQLVGTKITGQTSGVSAFVDKVLLPQDSERGNLTLYINYLNSSTQNNSTQVFSDGEELICNTTITSGLLGNTSISAGSPFALTIASAASATGSAFQIDNGVYFIRGNFVNVNKETLILDQYTTNPNYRVGLFVTEDIVTSDLDESLNDNSQGFNNYSSPGADRLKISVSLFKKALTDFDDDSFVELATIIDGNIKSKVDRGDLGGGPGYLDIRDTLAKRTYAESGDYYVKPFDVSFVNSLDDKLGSRGLFQPGQFTYGGSVPSDNLGIYKISPGRAFVRGYDVETIEPIFIDVEKPRTTKTVEDQSIIYNTGPTITLNRVYGAPTIGVGNTYVLSLRDSRLGVSSTTAPGNEIGVARVYDFRLESGTYSNTNSNTNQWDISLFDVQSYTDITLNAPITLSTPTFIKGANSGATAFLVSSVSNSSSLRLYETEGNFVLNESFIFDGIDNGRIAIAITSHSLSDVKSIFGTTDGVVGLNTFSADVIQSQSFNVGIASITASSGGISTVRSTNSLFPGSLVKVGSVVQYSDLSSSNDPILAKVVSVGSSTISIEGVADVPDIANGTLPSSLYNATDFKVLTTKLKSSSDNSLYTKLPKNNISSVDLTDASLTIRKTFTVNISSGQLSTPVLAGTDETFLPFDDERYTLIRSDGKTELLTSDRFSFLVGGSQLQILNLGDNDTGATLTATLSKVNPKAKSKIKQRVNSLIIDKSKYEGSGIGATTLNDGLTFGNYPFGTRVQDEIISLNVPDIIEIHGIYESADTSNPSCPRVVLSAINSASTTTLELVVGELIIGQTSGTVAIYAERITDSQVSFIYKNENTFREGETVIFQESNVQATITTLSSPSFEVSPNYTFTNGQEETFYDYGTIKRKSNSEEPSKKLKVYFSNGYYDSTDDGDLTTVESYRTFDYVKDIHSVNSFRNTDILDIRPRVSQYTVSEGSRSPLEFNGRTYNGSGNSAANILASDEQILTTFSFYLPRIDRIFLTKEGTFQVKYGVPAEKPEKPVPVDEALEIATIKLSPYLYGTSQASIEFLEHKRYRMVDIKQLENRIRNLEYYTSLSLLETNTANLFVPDADGLNRFKSGFLVDNFASFLPQENSIPIKNSIDINNKELRPRHYTNSVDLVFGPVTNIDPTDDLGFTPVEGVNIRRSNDVVTLDYAEIEYIKQSFATRSESVTPFLISFWQGTLELVPSSDTWVDTTRLEAKIIETEGNYAQTMNDLARTEGVDPQTGFGPIIWGSWQTNWTGTETRDSTRTRTDTRSLGVRGVGGWPNGGPNHAPAAWVETQEVTTRQDTLRETIQLGVESRTGTRTVVTEQFDRESVGDRVVSRDIIPFMRSRNIEFVSKRMKPLTQMYAFFDGVNVTKYCVPKLLEIQMISGSFQVGENVLGSTIKTGLGPDLTDNSPRITFRAAQSNHREGAYDTPIAVFRENPYNGQPLPATYSSTSIILNVDTLSLSQQAQGQYSGYVETGMTLIGQTSGARATITNVRLVSDLSANLIGSFFIPNPNNINHPRFETGTKTFVLVNDEQNNQDLATTLAEEVYTAAGTLETVQENIISIRNARVENKQEFEARNVNRSLGTQVVQSTILGSNRRETVIGWYDPLAQSFLIEDETGVFVTKCDVFFQSKDDMDIPVVFQLRTMENGFPTQKILPFTEIVLDPDQIITSTDGSVATTFEFKAPVYLEGGKEYAICLASNSTKYSVYVSRIGENDLLTDTFISNQPYLGSLFKSQNASTWEASQWEDLKFTIYRADFLDSGSVEFYSPELTEGNKQIAKLRPDSLELKSRKVRVGLSTILTDNGWNLGNTFSQLGTNATGNLVGLAGSISTGSLTITNPGIGYTPTDGITTFSSVNLVTITGNGSGAVANVTITNGVASAASITSGGVGYQIGDVLGISTIGVSSVGRNARLSVVSIASTNQLILDNVQGNFLTGAGYTMTYTNSSGVTTEFNYSTGGNVTLSSINVDSDGLHIKVNHQNHGMYFSDNLVKIDGVLPDIKPTKLTAEYTADSTGAITVDNAVNFTTFENVGVGTTNIGYLLIGSEIIEYTSVSGNVLGGAVVRGNNPLTYPIGTPVYKYELGGINLKRINKTHDLNDVTVSEPITFDSYHIKLNMENLDPDNDDRSDDNGYPALYVNQTKSSGGYNIKATQNMPFEVLTPILQNVTVRGTNITGEVRTITSKSISGNEIPYIDNGFESITLNEPNYLSSPRMIASKVNEDAKLSNIPGAKSMNMRIFMGTVDSRVSPVIDGQRVSAILTSNRVNNVITDYTTDRRVNEIATDPTACQYISKEVILENSASSLKILVAAHINTKTDIRAFYYVSNESGKSPIFTPFPGYSNLDIRGRIISSSNNNGESDLFIPKSNTYGFNQESINYTEYTFTADNLPDFRAYRVKLVLTSTSQVYVPRIKDLRIIALA